MDANADQLGFSKTSWLGVLVGGEGGVKSAFFNLSRGGYPLAALGSEDAFFNQMRRMLPRGAPVFAIAALSTAQGVGADTVPPTSQLHLQP